MQPNQSYLTAYLASKRSGAGVGLPGNDNNNSNANYAINNNGLNEAMGNSRMNETYLYPIARTVVQETEPSRAYISRTLPLPSNSGTNSINAQNRGLHASVALDTSSVSVGTSDEELTAAHQRTATLLNQYFSRQDQVNRREKLLLEQRFSSALGTSALMKPILEQFEQQQQALQLQQQLNTLLSHSTSDNLMLELLRRNDPLLFSTIHHHESASMSQLQQHLQQLQHADAQNKRLTLPMNITGNPGPYREFSAINPAQYDSAVLLSNFDDMTQARILSGLREIRQSTATSMAVEQMHRLNASRLLASNTSPSSIQLVGDSTSIFSNDRKPCASSSNHPNGKVESKIIHRMGRVGKFPLKLHVLLNDLKEQGRTDIAAFLPHGLAFGIFNTAEFANNIMPHHFRMSRYSSFQRQLNLYDFQRITEGPDKGAYHHRLFIEGQPDLLCGMKRNKIKGIAGKHQQPKNIDQLSPKPKVAAAIMTSNHKVDHYEHHAEDNETDDDSDDS